MTGTVQSALWEPGTVPAPRRPVACALCSAARPATPFGLCTGCLAAAAAEYARLASPALATEEDGSGDRRPCAVNYRDLCSRCGGWRHATADCPTLADVTEEAAP